MAGVNIIVPPEKLWDYFQEHRASLAKTMELVAENDDYDVILYLSEENGLPTLMVESSNIESIEYHITGEEDCAITAEMVYDLYLTDQIMTVMMEEAEGYNDDMSQLEAEDVIAEREADIDGFFTRLIEDLFPDEPILYTDLMDDLVDDCKEHMLEYLYRKHGLSVYRPMELEDDEGIFIEEYPYECMEFAPNPMYDDFEVTDLAINGTDIIALGIPQGKRVGEALEMVKQFVVGGIIPNDHDKIIDYLKSIKK